jgi:hypothetical protein
VAAQDEQCSQNFPQGQGLSNVWHSISRLHLTIKLDQQNQARHSGVIVRALFQSGGAA